MLYSYISQDLDERKVIDELIQFSLRNEHRPDLTLFYNLLFDPVRFNGIEEYNGFYLAKNILRKEIGIEREGKPGDYDIIFIPYNENKLFYERTAVFEVKIARPTFDNPSKSTNSPGKTQLYGLIEDGFPLVGLLHVVIAKPLLLEQTSKIKMAKEPVNIDWKLGDPPQTPFEDLFEDQPYDWLPWYSLNKQMARMIREGYPKYVGLNAFALIRMANGKHAITTSDEYRGFTSGYFNPNTQLATLKKIETHFREFKHERYKKIEIRPAK